MVLSFEQAGDLLDTLAESFPEALFDGLNGGVNFQEEAVPDQEFPKGQVYILGEYCDDLLGRYINLYYGSFAAMAENEDWTEEDWEQELRQTRTRRRWPPGRRNTGRAIPEKTGRGGPFRFFAAISWESRTAFAYRRGTAGSSPGRE